MSEIVPLANKKRGVNLALKVVATCAIVAVLLVLLRAVHARSRTGENPVPPVVIAAAKVMRDQLARELVFDSEFRPYQEIDLHPKVAGYLKNIEVDIGDHVE